MLTELRLIRNIGKYLNCAGSHSLKRMTLIYADNARGKTTLMSILRSLNQNEPGPIAVRQRLGTTDRPEIRIITSLGNHVFENGTWDSHYADMLVFDDHFIEANVYSGLAIGREQLTGLHGVILGAQSVALTREIEQIVHEITGVNSQLRDARAELQPHTYGLSEEEFIALEETPDVEQQIQAKVALLEQIQQAESISQQRAFEAVGVPEIAQADLVSLLSLSLANLDQGAIARTEQHFETLGQSGEVWVQTGLTLSRDRETCPFCEQDIQRNSLLDAYRAYFSQDYEQHVQDISDRTGDLLQSLRNVISALREAAAAEALWAFWQQYIKDLPPAPHYEAMAEKAAALLAQLQDALRLKAQSPLAAIDPSQSLIASLTDYLTTREAFVQQQALLMSRNADIEQVKSNVAAEDRLQVEDDLRRLRAIAARYHDDVVPLVQILRGLLQLKAALETDRDSRRDQLNRQRAARFPGYQTSVNEFLRKFGADFEIANVIPDNLGAAPSVQYALKINETDVGVEAFKNTLSAGDRSTLALAVFFAMLEDYPDLAGLVVVLDDPFTSMDKHRAHATVQEIRSLRTRAEQLIVLSHDGVFLWKIQEFLSQSERQEELASLEIVSDGWTASTLTQWDIAKQECTQYDEDHKTLRDFGEQAPEDPSAVAILLRPVMESYCRVAFPNECPPGKLLGQFRNDEISRRSGGRGILDEHDFRELCDITDYASKFHHASNTTTNFRQELRNVNANELKSYVDRILDFTAYRRADRS